MKCIQRMFIATLYLTILSPIVLAQDVFTNIETFDGNKISGKITQKFFEFNTKYGKLSPTVSDIRQVNLGVHPPEGVADNIDKALKNLGSIVHEKRISAQKELIDVYRFSYFQLKQHKTMDMEVTRRIENVLKEIGDTKDFKYLPAQAYDVMYMGDGSTLHGFILNKDVIIETNDFGTLKVHLSQIRLLRNCNSIGREFELDPSKGKEWVNTGIQLENKVSLLGSGTINLWPQDQIGKYICGPSGLDNTNAGQFPAGALLGKIGENGTTFLIGSKFSNDNVASGLLYIRYNDPFWNVVPTGSFKVTVK